MMEFFKQCSRICMLLSLGMLLGACARHANTAMNNTPAAASMQMVALPVVPWFNQISVDGPVSVTVTHKSGRSHVDVAGGVSTTVSHQVLMISDQAPGGKVTVTSSQLTALAAGGQAVVLSLIHI